MDCKISHFLSAAQPIRRIETGALLVKLEVKYGSSVLGCLYVTYYVTCLDLVTLLESGLTQVAVNRYVRAVAYKNANLTLALLEY